MQYKESGPGRSSLTLKLCTTLAIFGALVCTSTALAASVATDKLDYPPGDTVWIMGEGFKPTTPLPSGELVEMSVRHITKSGLAEGEYGPWTAQADPKGNFSSYWVVPYNDSIVGATLELTATGLSSGIVASTQFTDANVVLEITTIVPDTICPGDTTAPGRDSLYLCARLLQGGCNLPLEGRPIRFYWNPGNCGVDTDAEGEDTVFTDADGYACTDMAIPDASGDWVLRVKFDGEDKPNPCPTPGNSVCDPTDANANKRCISLSNSNICQGVVIDTVACCTAPLCSLGTFTSPSACTPDSDFVSFTSSDPDDGLDTCFLYGPGELVNGGWLYVPTGGDTVSVRIVCYNTCGDSCVTEFERTYPERVVITCQVPNDTTIVQCDPAEVSLPASAIGASCTITGGPGTLSNGNWVYTPSGDEVDTVTIQCISTDFCDTCSATFIVSFDVNDPPTIQCPSNVTFECDSIGGFGSATFTDDRDSNLVPYVVSRDSVPGNCENEYTLRLRYVVKDVCGDSAYCDQSITVVDTTAPSIDCPDTNAYSCESVPTTWETPGATDNCDSSPLVRQIGIDTTVSTECAENFTISISWVAVDACGNADTCTQTVLVSDTTAPELTCPLDTTLSCTDDFPIPGGLKSITSGAVIKGAIEWPFGVPSATDNCDDTVAISGRFGDILDADSCNFVFEARYYAYDNCGNVDSCTQIVTVVDTLAPEIECPVSSRYECNAIPTTFDPPQATDACNSVSVTEVDRFKEDSLCPYNYTLVIVWEAKDKCGNADSCRQLVYIYDETGPVITMPDPITYNCDSVPEVFPLPSAVDQCDSDPSLVPLQGARGDSCNATYEIVWTATDACGNSTVDTQYVYVTDRTAPVISCPDTLTFECDERPDIDSLPRPTVTDNCDTNVTLERFPASSTDPNCPDGSELTILWVATDNCGNADSCTQVVYIVDTTAPVLDKCDTLFVFECGIFGKTQESITPFLPTATDNCDPAPEVRYVYLPGGGTYPCDYVYNFGIYAVDRCGNVSDTCYQTIKVVDTTAPVIACPDSLIFDCPTLPQLIPPTATDNCEQYPVDVVNLGYRVEDSTCLWSYRLVITWEATDYCGNKDTCEQIIRIQDTTKPELTCEDLRYECDNLPGEWPTPTAIDLCDPAPTVTLLSNSDTTVGGCPQRYSFVLTWEATDDCGNADTCRQTVYVTDTTKPVVVCPPDTTISCEHVGEGKIQSIIDSLLYWPFGNATATDNCDTMPVIGAFQSGQQGELPCLYVISIGYYATDDCGNVSDTCYRTVTIRDTTPPEITCPADTTLECDELQLGTLIEKTGPQPGWPFGEPSATDNCDDSLVTYWTIGPLLDEDPCNTRFRVIYWAFDDCQNFDTCSQVITIVDTTAPVVQCAADTTVYCSNGELPPCFDDKLSGKSGEKFLCDFRIIDTLYDNCDANIEYQYELFYDFSKCPQYIRAKIWAVDRCDNTSDTCYWTAYFADTTAPVITCPQDISAECGQLPTDWGWPRATDDCGNPVISLIDQDTVAQSSCYLEVIRTFEAKDFCGNADTCEQRIVAGDSTAPEITCPADTSVDCSELGQAEGKAMLASLAPLAPKGIPAPCDGPYGIYDYRYGRPTVTDNCSEYSYCLINVEQIYADSCRTVFELLFGASDICGNTDTCTQRVTFVDTTGPVLVCATDTTIYCDRDKATCIELKGEEPFKLDDKSFLCGFRMVDTVYDGCCEDVEVFARLTYHLNRCPAYIKAFIWAVDCCGNYSDTCTWILNIADTSAPTIVCPLDQTYECAEQQGDWGWPTATDNCDDAVVITLVDQDTLTEGCQTIITRSFSAADRCKNESRCQQVITIADTTDPVCSVPNDTTIFLCSPGQQVCLPVSATDNCDQAVDCIVHDGIGVVANGQWCYAPTGAGTHTVYIRCTDDCGNFCVSDFTVTFELNSAPECRVPNDTTIYLCDPGDVSFDWMVIDPDGNLANCFLTVTTGDTKSIPASNPDTVFANLTVFVEKDMFFCAKTECVDSCGAVCVDSFCVTIDITEPPVCYQTPDTTVSLCNPQEICVLYDWPDPVISKSSDAAFPTKGGKNKTSGPKQLPNTQNPGVPISKTLLDACDIISGPGYLRGDYWCWTPPDYDTVVTVLVRCADTCGHSCENEFTVTFNMNEDPVCDEIADTSVFLCRPAPVCITVGSTDTEGDSVVCAVVSGPGTVENGQWCYTPEEDGIYNVTIRCTDTCGAYCEESFSLTVEINDPPVCELPNDTTIFLCDTATICLPVSATDVNGNFWYCDVEDETKTNGFGYIQNGMWCYFASQSGLVTVPIICFDSCRAFCEGEFTVTFVMNTPPVCELPNDTTIFLCEPGTVCLPIGATDVDGNFSHCAIDETKGNGSGYIQNGQWCFDVTQDVQLTVPIVCYDSCGAVCRGEFTVTFDVNEAPICQDLADTAVFLCEPSVVCRTFGATDADGNLADCQVISGLGSVGQGQWCFTPEQSGLYEVTIRCTDSCGAYCDETFAVTVDMNEPPQCITPPSDTTIYLCEPTNVCIGGWGGTDPDGNLDNCILLDDDKQIAGVGGVLEWCDFISTDQTVLITIQCTDSCGAICTQDVFIHFVMNLPPVINLGPDISTQVGDGEVCFNYTVGDPDGPEGLEEQLLLFPAGAVIDTAANTICWTPAEGGNFMFVGQVIDSCGATDFDTAFVLVSQPQPPTCQLPGDTTIFLCTATQINLPVSAVGLNPPITCAVVAGPGSVSGGFWRYTPPGPGVYNVTIRCTNSIGQFCQDGFQVTVGINQPPVCSAPSDTGFCLCPNQSVSLTLNGYDPDGNITGYQLLSGPGSITGNVWNHTPLSENEFLIRWRVMDACGRADTCQTTVRIDFNDGPIFSRRDDTTITMCTAGPVCIPLQITDQNHNVTSVQVTSGYGYIEQTSPTSWSWCFTPPDNGTYSATVLVTDACGRTAQRTFNVTFIVIDEPMCDLPASGTYLFCQSPVCIPIAGNEPPPQRGVTCTIVDGPGYISGGNWCVNISGTQTFQIMIRCTNSCGAQCQISRNYTFTVDPNDCSGAASVGATYPGPLAGDINGSGEVNIADLALLTAIVNQWNVKGKTAAIDVSAAAAGYQYRADVDCNGRVDYADVAYLTQYLFSAGPAPCEPRSGDE